MPSASTLKDVYIEELRDLWSANDQMQRVMQSLSDKASDTTLKELLARSVGGIGQHTASLKSILEAQGGNVGKDHCKGMEGLVAEAKKHALEGEFDGQLRDIVIIAQYQRMSHYGLAGFGTAAAYAHALGMKDDVAKLKSIASDIYKADEYTANWRSARNRRRQRRPAAAKVGFLGMSAAPKAEALSAAPSQTKAKNTTRKSRSRLDARACTLRTSARRARAVHSAPRA